MADLSINGGREQVVVDDELHSHLRNKNWRGSERQGVKRVYRQGAVTMTESLAYAITGRRLKKGEKWGHQDGNWRNFRASNLQVVRRGDQAAAVTRAAQDLSGAATGRFTGVYVSKRKFRAECSVDGQRRYLGLWNTAEEAAYAYDLVLQVLGWPARNGVQIENAAEVESRVRENLRAWDVIQEKTSSSLP